MNKMSVRPTKPVAVMGMVAALAMGAFGLFFLGLLIKEGSGVGIAFMAVWFVVLGVIIAYYVYTLKSRKGIIEIEMDSATPDGSGAQGFDARLRRLELLKKDGLVTEEEYRTKRAEIMADKW